MASSFAGSPQVNPYLADPGPLPLDPHEVPAREASFDTGRSRAAPVVSPTAFVSRRIGLLRKGLAVHREAVKERAREQRVTDCFNVYLHYLCEVESAELEWADAWIDHQLFVPCRVSGPGVERAELTPRECKLRLRPRSRLTRTLDALGRGLDWWEDLVEPVSPARRACAWLQAYLGPGLKAVRIHARRLRSDSGVLLPAHVVGIPLGSGGPQDGLWVCPELIADLASSACFRAPTYDLLQSLRGRARYWAQDIGLGQMEFSLLLPGSLVLAAQGSAQSLTAVSVLRSDRGRYAHKLLSALEKGRAVSVSSVLGGWEGFRRALRWWKSPGMLEGSAQSLEMGR